MFVLKITTSNTRERKLLLLSLFLCVCLQFTQVIAADNCDRPEILIEHEKVCFEETSDFIERVQHHATGLFNRAKKLVGIATEEMNEPKKCEFYECIFNKMNVLTLANIPDVPSLREWIEKNSQEGDQKRENSLKADVCFNKLYDSLKSGSEFDGVVAEKNVIRERDLSELKLSELKTNQSACEIDKEFMLCLNWQVKCILFKYP